MLTCCYFSFFLSVVLLHIYVTKTKVMAGDSIACCILNQNKQLEQVDNIPYLGSLITEGGECTTEFCTRLNKGQIIWTSQ